MKINNHCYSLFIGLVLLLNVGAYAQKGKASNKTKPNSALLTTPYSLLPYGAIQPEGWVKDQLVKMKAGLTGQLDQQYGQVAGKRNAWLGGDGDAWERGPYWIDGLLPLAYILKDKALIAKVQPWVDWTIRNQRNDGYIGPALLKERPVNEPGIQKGPREDWWPRMVMLKVLQQYYDATGDKRVISTLTRYFKYQLQQLPKTPLDHWTFWGNQRGADNLMVVYWLYNITGDDFLLQLGDLIYQQTFPFTRVFLNENTRQNGIDHLYPYNTGNKYPFNDTLIQRLHLGQLQSFHCVNIAQGIKTPIVYYQRQQDSLLLQAAKKGLADLEKYHGQAQGMYGGDEPLHGNSPTQGIEFCSIAEMMFSLETMLGITGDVDFADRLEKITFNALPTQATDDFMNRQYLQTANQVLITRATRNFFEDGSHGATDACFGLLTGYPCCTANMHQAWPKWVQNLWYKTADDGVAALLYAPSKLRLKLNNNQTVTIHQQTQYPFEETIRFTIDCSKTTRFPFHLRIPQWADNASITINGKPWNGDLPAGSIVKLNEVWKNGDKIELRLPMTIRTSRWAESSAAVERGPLVFALKIEEDWKKVINTDQWGSYYEVHPKSAWNYGLLRKAIADPAQYFEVVKQQPAENYPWNLKNTPLVLKTQAKKIASWQLYNNAAGPLPNTMTPLEGATAEEIILVPYGCSTLRIAQFPVID